MADLPGNVLTMGRQPSAISVGERNLNGGE
jgi:hypothetical protein